MQQTAQPQAKSSHDRRACPYTPQHTIMHAPTHLLSLLNTAHGTSAGCYRQIQSRPGQSGHPPWTLGHPPQQQGSTCWRQYQCACHQHYPLHMTQLFSHTAIDLHSNCWKYAGSALQFIINSVIDAIRCSKAACQACQSNTTVNSSMLANAVLSFWRC